MVWKVTPLKHVNFWYLCQISWVYIVNPIYTTPSPTRFFFGWSQVLEGEHETLSCFPTFQTHCTHVTSYLHHVVLRMACCVGFCLSSLGVGWLVVSTHRKNICQIGNLPQNRDKTKKYFKPPPSWVLFAKQLGLVRMYYVAASCFFGSSRSRYISLISAPIVMQKGDKVGMISEPSTSIFNDWRVVSLTCLSNPDSL